MSVRARAHTHTHTHTKRGKEKTGYSVDGEGVTKRAASGPFGTFCHHVVIKRAGVTKRAGCTSNLTQFVTLVTKCAAVTKRTATTVNIQTDKQDSMTGQGLNGGMLGREWETSKLECFGHFKT